MIKALTDFYNALVETLLLWITDILEFLLDMLLLVLDGFLTGLLAVLALLPTPDFITNGLQSFIGDIDPGVIWLLHVSGFADAIALLGLGFAFRIIRKTIPFVRW